MGPEPGEDGGGEEAGDPGGGAWGGRARGSGGGGLDPVPRSGVGVHVRCVPEWCIENDIHETHAAYLFGHGGRRPVSESSTHHSIKNGRGLSSGAID